MSVHENTLFALRIYERIGNVEPNVIFQTQMKAEIMIDIDLNSLSLDELKRLQKDVNKAVEGYEARKRQDAFSAAEAAAREMGYTLAELTGASKKKLKSASVPKYRHSENADQTWSGRGRQPEWMKEALAAGQSKDDFLIKE